MTDVFPHFVPHIQPNILAFYAPHLFVVTDFFYFVSCRPPDLKMNISRVPRTFPDFLSEFFLIFYIFDTGERVHRSFTKNFLASFTNPTHV